MNERPAELPVATVVAALLSGIAVVASGQEGPPAFPSAAEVVVLDVVATDGKGRPIDDLRQDELTVREDGRPCEILSLRLVRASSSSPRPSERPAPQGAGVVATPTRASLVVLLFDRLTTRTAPLAREGALDLVSREFPPDTWFAVMKTGYGVRLLAPFTTNPERLRSAIETATLGDPDLRGSRAPGLPPIRVQPDTPPETPTDPGQPAIPDLRPVAQGMEGEERSLAWRVEGYNSLLPLLGVSRALAAVEGRKAVVYFAEGWQVPAGVQSVYADAVSAANRANVAIHTVDVRGLVAQRPVALTPTDSVLDRFSADHREEAGAGASTPSMEAGGVSPDRPNIRDKVEKREDQLRGPALERLADDTGGLAVASTNDIAAGLAAVAQELRHYWEIVYAPVNPVADGRFRRVAVQVVRRGVRLRTRAGYIAAPARAPAIAAHELPLVGALTAEVSPRDFAVRAGVLHFGPKGEGTQCVALVSVPLSEVQLAADPASRVYRAHLTLLGYVKDAGGGVVARLAHDWPIEGPLDERQSARKRHALFRKTLLLAPGRYTLEIAIQDRHSGGRSVTRSPFEVPRTLGDLALGSVTVVSAAGPASDPSADDPLRVGSVSLVPTLGPLDVSASGDIPVLVAVYPGTRTDPVELTVAFHAAGREIARIAPELADADSDGRIAWLGSVPAVGLAEGAYEVVATARQGDAAAEERAVFHIASLPSPDGGRSRTPHDPELIALLERASRYVVDYQETFSNLVAEEHYTQIAGGTGQGFTQTATAPVRLADGSQMQTTRADLVFVRLAAETPWGLFRDVFEVNGNRVRDRDERLEEIFLKASPSALDQARRILEESARYNIGPWRTVNLPTMALMFLHPRNQGRFSFEKGGRRRIGGFEGVEVRFQEVERPPITTDSMGGPVPADGRFWIDASRGTVLRSETRYRFEPNRATGFVATEYRNEPRLGIWVPSEMKERYRDADGTRDPVFRHPAEATARYSNFRVFRVTTDDQVVRTE